MTVVLDKTVEVAATESSDHLAGWLARAGALVVDVVFGVALVATMAVLQAATPQYGVLWWYYVSIAVLAAIAVVVNRLVLPAVRGWSLGRALFGIAVVRADQSEPSERVGKTARWSGAVIVVLLVVAPAAIAVLLQRGTLQGFGVPWWLFAALAAVTLVIAILVRFVLPRVRDTEATPRDTDEVDPVRLVLREFAHLLDTLAVFVGWLWPLWDSKNRTFADMLARTEVHRVRSNGGVLRPKVRRLTGIAVLVVGALCATGVGLNYLVVYRYESSVDAARADISHQGPGIVEQILSYGADTRGEDFSRAQSLVTDEYRPQLVEQQLAVASVAPFTNEFWTVNSSVLSATPDTASMLIMMQGRRATSNEDAKFVTATVRAAFVKSPDGSWKVSGLDVLTKPRPQLEAEG